MILDIGGGTLCTLRPSSFSAGNLGGGPFWEVDDEGEYMHSHQMRVAILCTIAGV